MSAKPLKASEIEALSEIEVNKAVKIFKDALAAEDGEEASLFEVIHLCCCVGGRALLYLFSNTE